MCAIPGNGLCRVAWQASVSVNSRVFQRTDGKNHVGRTAVVVLQQKTSVEEVREIKTLHSRTRVSVPCRRVPRCRALPPRSLLSAPRPPAMTMMMRRRRSSRRRPRSATVPTTQSCRPLARPRTAQSSTSCCSPASADTALPRRPPPGRKKVAVSV